MAMWSGHSIRALEVDCKVQDQNHAANQNQRRRTGVSAPHDLYPASTAPPFTLSTSPVIKPASGVHRNRIGAAISSGFATRPNGMVAKIVALLLGLFNAGADMSVSTQPGATQLT